MKYLRRYNESKDSDKSKIENLINSGEKIKVVSINNFKNDNGEITFTLVAKGVWMKGESVTQVSNILRKEYDNVKVTNTGKNVLDIYLRNK